VIQISTKNGSASDVSVALTSQPTTQKPEFTSGCAKGDGTASCTVRSVTAAKHAVLHAQIAVASGAKSVSKVKLTATASIATTVKWTPPAADETIAVTSASAAPAHSSATPSPGASHVAILPLGPVPNLNSEASRLIGAGNASGLFPVVSPSAKSDPVATNHPPSSGKPNAEPVSNSTTLVPVGTSVSTAQVAGLIALGLAIMLTVTRLSLRKRSRSGDQGGPGSQRS
jgi:hypothetical protein